MPSINEIGATAQTSLQSVLQAGVETLAIRQQITFLKYIRVVLPIDGFVFWIRSDLIGAAQAQDRWTIGPQPTEAGAASMTILGSLHYAIQRRQEAESTQAINSVIFTSEELVQPLNNVDPSTLWIGSFEGIRFSFSNRLSYYAQASLHHYIGEAVYPTFETQIIDDIAQLGQRQIVSNSLPFWLTLNRFGIVFPAFLGAPNTRPPFLTAHVLPNTTKALSAMEEWHADGSMSQLTSERVRISLYGFDNETAWSYKHYVEQYSINADLIGIMNMATVKDETLTQPELAVIAMKKVIEFEVSYHQGRARGVARKFIKSVIPTYTVGSTTDVGPTLT